MLPRLGSVVKKSKERIGGRKRKVQGLLFETGEGKNCAGTRSWPVPEEEEAGRVREETAAAWEELRVSNNECPPPPLPLLTSRRGERKKKKKKKKKLLEISSAAGSPRKSRRGERHFCLSYQCSLLFAPYFLDMSNRSIRACVQLKSKSTTIVVWTFGLRQSSNKTFRFDNRKMDDKILISSQTGGKLTNKVDAKRQRQDRKLISHTHTLCSASSVFRISGRVRRDPRRFSPNQTRST